MLSVLVVVVAASVLREMLANACAQLICEKNSKIVVKVLINIYACMCIFTAVFV